MLHFLPVWLVFLHGSSDGEKWENHREAVAVEESQCRYESNTRHGKVLHLSASDLVQVAES